MSPLIAYLLGLASGVIFSVAIKAAYAKWVAPKVAVLETDVSKAAADLKGTAATGAKPVASVPAAGASGAKS